MISGLPHICILHRTQSSHMALLTQAFPRFLHQPRTIAWKGEATEGM